MSRKVIVDGDPVKGTNDQHAVTGLGTSGSSTVSYTGKGTYPYDGAMTDALSDFVKIGGRAVALVSSGSTLSSGHSPLTDATLFTPATPTPTQLAFSAPPVGAGTPTSGAGSSFVTVRGKAILLDDDKIDTCGAEKGQGNSTVSATKQSFVTVSR